jgi:hypothetical protein
MVYQLIILLSLVFLLKNDIYCYWHCMLLFKIRFNSRLKKKSSDSRFESRLDNHVCDNWGVQSVHVESWKLILVVFIFISITNWNFWTFGSWVAASNLLFWKQTVWTFFVALIHQIPETMISFCCLSVMFEKLSDSMCQ